MLMMMVNCEVNSINQKTMILHPQVEKRKYGLKDDGPNYIKNQVYEEDDLLIDKT